MSEDALFPGQRTAHILNEPIHLYRFSLPERELRGRALFLYNLSEGHNHRRDDGNWETLRVCGAVGQAASGCWEGVTGEGWRFAPAARIQMYKPAAAREASPRSPGLNALQEVCPCLRAVP